MLKSYLKLILLVLFCATQSVAQNDTAPKKVESSEYNQYKNLADGYYNEGNYNRANQAYKLCLTVPTFDNDPAAIAQVAICQKIITAQSNFESTLKTNGDINTALQNLRQALSQNSKDISARQRIALQLEQDGDSHLKKNEYETAAQRYILIQTMAATKNIGFKIEKTNELYLSKFKKPLPQYVTFVQNQKSTELPTTKAAIADDAEYIAYRDAANEAFKSGNYESAKLKYNAAMQVPNYEADKYAEDQLVKSSKIIHLKKKTDEAQAAGDFRSAYLFGKEALVLNPYNSELKKQVAQATETLGDELLAKGLFADAKTSYQEAMRLGGSDLSAKIVDVEIKIAEIRTTAATAKQALMATPLQPRKEKDPFGWLGIQLYVGSYRLMPQLDNGSGQVNTSAGLQFYGGGQVVLFPSKKIAVFTGLNVMSNTFGSTNTSQSNKVESIALNLIQIPVGLRFNKRLGRSDFDLHFQAAVTVNKPTKFSYINHTTEANSTDLSSLNTATMGYQGAIGISKYLSKHHAIFLMINCQQTNNLLNNDYKDNATNRSRASMALSGIGIELIFRLF
jgi:tetratricopeptide (TPR) repeat protein